MSAEIIPFPRAPQTPVNPPKVIVSPLPGPTRKPKGLGFVWWFLIFTALLRMFHPT